ncbi:MAG TPA: GreA/GreB family elongation factor [Candidatus Paceibacterota bacterium]|nr:GreA/GreB family elongation factor [Verrucomicrobiota bacterium]HOX01512.1 GreA/GreB family elongation factor [Verrucomicrobiota bacterium]HRZ44250.1 GreA/GreB family elongation factor [Candidatus Paceibacterota bacterium]HRZ91878.1 GreA/GreB family elongation factor [Candidatus Paceibacterota bacterium]
MREEFEKLVSAGKISRAHVDRLVQLAHCGYCRHRSWGFGKITAVDTIFSRFMIDFAGKPGHSMDLAFAAHSLEPIPPTHILARKAHDLSGLRQMAALHHLELIKLVLDSYGGKATLEQIQQVLVPDVITEDWRKWWEAARRELKKDGHFLVPMRKADPIRWASEEVSLQDRLMAEFRGAKGLKARLVQAHEILKNHSDLADPAAAVREMCGLLNAEIATHQRTQPALALEAIFVRDETRQATAVAAAEPELGAKDVWAHQHPVGEVLDQVTASRHKHALESFRASCPDQWAVVLIEALNHVSSKLCGEIVKLLSQEGRIEEFKAWLARLISQHLASSELLLWLARERSDSFADILGPELFRAMLTAVERDQFLEKKSNRLRDYMLDDPTLLVDLIESADLDVIKDLTRTLQLSPSFDDMDKRSLLARIVKHFPAIQSLISGDQHARQESSLVVSWESLERRKAEYDELVHKRIPSNSHEISVARSYGDLNENHEYKAAKEMQKLLMRRKAELESQLARARGTDFVSPRTDVVSIGTRVHVTDLADSHGEIYIILGAWDFDAQRGIISYLSPIAQSLLNRAVGEEIELEHDHQLHRYRIERIEAYIQTPPAPLQSDAAPAAPLEAEASVAMSSPSVSDPGSPPGEQAADGSAPP